MSSENWADERERLVAVLRDYESGRITQFDQVHTGQRDGASPAEHIESVKRRIVSLDARLGGRCDEDSSGGV